MDTELHKMVEIAADKYIKIITPDDIPYYHRDVKQGFIAGAEYGYKEAIAQAKEWIRDRNRHACKEWLDKECADFESDMNKLWEEQK